MDNVNNLISYSQQIKLLYVEDNAQAREAILSILGEFFADIVVAVNGEDGLIQFNNHQQNYAKKIELLITDINMPKMNGLDMIEQIKKINPELPVLVFSAYNESDFFIKSIKLGVDGYLLKPFDLKQFTQILSKIVQRINLQTEAQKSQNFLQQYKDITDKSAVISIIDTNGVITYANDAYCTIAELPIHELIGSKYYLTTQYHQSKALYNEIWSTIRDKKQIWQGETKYISKSGKTYYLKNTIKPILDTNGEIVEYIALRDDITEIRLAAQERENFLLLQKAEAIRANKAKSAFIANMSHELRTPMNAILGFTHILKYNDQLSGEQLDYIKEINKAGKHLLKLINSLLDLTRVESGNLEIVLEPVVLSEVVDECFTLLFPVAKNNEISMSHSNLDNYIIQADQTRLKQVLLNLLNNAINYNKKQGSIKLEASKVSNNKLRISITDTGNGISDENLKKLFQPFTRFDIRKNNIEGTGIGLKICKDLVNMMNGNIGADSQFGVGSTFWLELPLNTVEKTVEKIAELTTEV